MQRHTRASTFRTLETRPRSGATPGWLHGSGVATSRRLGAAAELPIALVLGGSARMRVRLVSILVLAAGCGAAPGTEPGAALRPATVEEVRALVRPFVSPADPSGPGAGVLAGTAPRLQTVVSFV